MSIISGWSTPDSYWRNQQLPLQRLRCAVDIRMWAILYAASRKCMGYHLLNTEIFKLYLDKVTKKSIKYIKKINLTVFQNRWERRVDLSGYLRELQIGGDCSMDGFCWMAFRGRPEILISVRVGTDGNRTRYKSGVYVCTWESGQFVKLSGTAIIRFLLPSQATDSLWRIFFIYKENLLYGTPCNAGKSADGRWVSQQLTHPGKKEESGGVLSHRQ